MHLPHTGVRHTRQHAVGQPQLCGVWLAFAAAALHCMALCQAGTPGWRTLPEGGAPRARQALRLTTIAARHCPHVCHRGVVN